MTNDQESLESVSSKAAMLRGHFEVEGSERTTCNSGQDSGIEIEPLHNSFNRREILLGIDIYRKSKVEYFLYLVTWGGVLLWLCYRWWRERNELMERWKENIDTNLDKIENHFKT